MPKRPPKIDHVKIIRPKRGNGKEYAYFHTGQTVNGKAVRVPIKHPSQPGFWEQYAALCAGRTKRAKAAYTVATLADEYTRSPDFDDKAENTRTLYQRHIDKVVDLWGEFAVNDLTPEDVREATDKLGWGAGTHNMMLAVLGVIFTWGRKRGKTTAEPVKDMERRKLGSHEPWPDDVLEAALLSDDADIRLAVHLMAFTGLRIGDALALRWGDIRGDVIHVTPEKTKRLGKRLHIPLAADLRDELAKAPRKGLTVLHGMAARTLRIAMKEFGREYGAEVVPHGLRKNAVQNLLLAGCSIAETAAITGQTYQIVEHYAAKVNTRQLAKAAIVKLDARRGRNGS